MKCWKSFFLRLRFRFGNCSFIGLLLILMCVGTTPAGAQSWTYDGFESSSAEELESRPLLDATELIFWTSIGADLATTEIALRHPGTYEGNPLMRRREVRFAYMIGHGVLATYLYRQCGRCNGARIPILILSGLHFSASGWNLQYEFRF